MSRGVNKAIIVGTLGQDPELRHSADGGAVVNITVATNEKWKDKNGIDQESVEWHRLVMFGRLAEIAGEYLKKGSQAYFEGKITTRKWSDKEGRDRYSTEIIAREMLLLSNPNRKPGEHGAAPGPAKDYQDKSGNKTAGDGFDDIPFAPVDWRAS